MIGERVAPDRHHLDAIGYMFYRTEESSSPSKYNHPLRASIAQVQRSQVDTDTGIRTVYQPVELGAYMAYNYLTPSLLAHS